MYAKCYWYLATNIPCLHPLLTSHRSTNSFTSCLSLLNYLPLSYYSRPPSEDSTAWAPHACFLNHSYISRQPCSLALCLIQRTLSSSPTSWFTIMYATTASSLNPVSPPLSAPPRYPLRHTLTRSTLRPALYILILQGLSNST